MSVQLEKTRKLQEPDNLHYLTENLFGGIPVF